MRRFARHPSWTTRDYVLMSFAGILVLLDTATAIGTRMLAFTLPSAALALMGLAGLYRELPPAEPVAKPAEPPPAPAGPPEAYRVPAPGAPPPPPPRVFPRVSRLGRGVLAVYLAIHVALLIAGAVAVVVAVLAFAFALFTCGRH
jgi:hypothetical protein